MKHSPVDARQDRRQLKNSISPARKTRSRLIAFDDETQEHSEAEITYKACHNSWSINMKTNACTVCLWVSFDSKRDMFDFGC